MRKSFSDKTILIAEDGPTARFFFKEALKDYGVKILFAVNGAIAVKLYSEHPEIDLILMDLGMPVMDGFEAMKKILNLNPKARIIVQTAYSMMDEEKRCFEIGCTDFLAKPIQKNLLFETLEKWI